MSEEDYKYFKPTPNWWVELKDFMFTAGEAFEGTHRYDSKKRPRYKYWEKKLND